MTDPRTLSKNSTIVALFSFVSLFAEKINAQEKKEEKAFSPHHQIGTEYGYELPGDWEIFGTLSYEVKWNAYDSWGLGLGILKNFGVK